MFLEIINAKHINAYSIELTFNNGEKLIVDLESYLKGEIFEPLRDLSQFKQFSIPHNTIEWPNGADLAPEFLYDLAQKQAEENNKATGS